MTADDWRKVASEALGTALLLAIVVGSGVMGEALAGGNEAIALLGNTLSTGAGLIVLILIFGPVSGAHFNPAVTAVFLARQEIGLALAGAFVAAQVVGGALGVFLAHAMFDLEILQTSERVRSGPGQAIGEMTATFGLVLTILGCRRSSPNSVPFAVGLYIAAAYWFTSSTSFANPAVTIARTMTDTFAGVRPVDAPMFIVAQMIGAAAGAAASNLLFENASAKR